MTLKGETLATGASEVCPACDEKIDLKVCHSPAGYYVGAWCKCGPYCRESGYYSVRVLAKRALDSGNYSR